MQLTTEQMIAADMQAELWRRLTEIEQEAARISEYLLEANKDRRMAGATWRQLQAHIDVL